MPIIPRGQIKSHRMLSHWFIAPWIVATVATLVVIALVGIGSYRVLRKPCSGDITATIVASPDTATVLEGIARSWMEEEPVVAGLCAGVDIESKDAPSVADALGQEWDTKTNGPRPDAWVPDSSLWVRQAAANETVAAMLPESQPSLVRTVSVIAMPQPMAEALGWPNTDVTWTTLINEIAQAGWTEYGQAAWGSFRIGMSNPTVSTAALMAIAAIMTPDSTGRPPSQGIATVNRLKASQAFLEEDTDTIIADVTTADVQGADMVYGYISAFPAMETDIITYNQGSPSVPLVAVYPSDGSFDADNPCVVLSADWVTEDKATVASNFLEYARSSENRSAFIDAGFRDSDRAGGDSLSESNGVIKELTVAAREIPDTATLAEIISTWTG